MYYCRVPRTHSLYHKLIKIHQASPPFRSLLYPSTFNYQSKSQFKITSNSSISNPTKTYPNSLYKHSAHTCLFSTIHCYVVLSNASPCTFPVFTYSYWPLAVSYVILSTSTLYHRKALFSPVLSSIYLLDRVSFNFSKVENPDFRCSPLYLIVPTWNLHHVDCLCVAACLLWHRLFPFCFIRITVLEWTT